MPDLLIPHQDVPLRKKKRPVAFLAADKRQRGRASVRHVRPDVQKIFEEPETAEGNRRGLALPPEIDTAEERHDQLAERAAENHDRVAEPTEEKMTALVNYQIHEINNQKAGCVGGGIEKKEQIERQPRDSKDAKDRFQLREIIAKQGHGSRVTSNFKSQKKVALLGFLSREPCAATL